MANLIYTHPVDNVAPSATWTVTSGAASATYPIANINDDIPAKPFKATGTSVTLRATFVGAQSIELVNFAGQHNLAGATVKLDNNAGMVQQTISIPANREDGQSVNPYLDLSSVSNHSATQWTFTITGASSAVAIGEIQLWLTKRSLPANPRYGFTDDELHRLIEHQTDFGTVKPPYDLGATERTFKGLSVVATVANVATIRSWFRACYGRVKACLVVLDPSVNDARVVRFLEPHWEYVLAYPDVHTTSFSLEEVGRGPTL